MNILKVIASSPNEKYLNQAIDELGRGYLIIYPTDTLYAFGCDALNNSAIEKICKIKRLKSEKISLSIMCKDIAQAAEYARIDDAAFRLLKINTPGEFTFILPTSNKLPKAFKGRKEVGIRIPNNKIVIDLIEKLGHPIMTTSIPVTDVDESTEPDFIARNYANSVSLILDSGRGNIVPSTIVNCTNELFEIIRDGKGELIYP